MSQFHSITVLGTGVLGSQIAFQTAYSGHPVVAYDINDEALEAAKARFASLAESYKAEVAPAKTVFATNSSTPLPSDIAAYTGRPEKLFALHFANRIWIHNTGEVMASRACRLARAATNTTPDPVCCCPQDAHGATLGR